MDITFKNLTWLKKYEQEIVSNEIKIIDKKLQSNKKKIVIMGMDYNDYKRYVDVYAPDWVVASIMHPNVIILLSKLKLCRFEYVKSIIKHEFVHIALLEVEKCCPKYIFEGIAMHIAGQEEFYINKNEIMTISISYNDDNFYGKSYYLIQIALKKYGYDKLLYLIKNKKFDEINKTVVQSINNSGEELDAKICDKRS